MKRLCVYYSYTGNTRIIAEKIKATLNCDLLELKPRTPYSEDYQTIVDEYQNNESDKKLEDLEKYEINLEEYDEIIIGTPVWWYTITPVIRTFLTKENLKGKKIIPFATNAGWLGESFKEIKELCPASIIKDEMNIVFSEDYSEHKIKNEKEVNDWIERIDKS